jgi:uncharacterized protein YceK
MPTRVIALIVAVVVLWSGFSTIESPRTSGSLPSGQYHAIVQTGGVAAEGSVEDHHLDDLPSQLQQELPAETPGLPPAALKPNAGSLAMAQPMTDMPAGAGSPLLAGPLRPPSHTASRS